MAQTLSIARSTHGRQGAVLAICWLCACCSPARALDYEPIQLACLLARADWVVSVRLPRSGEGFRYWVDVQDVLYGQVALSRFQVQEPAPWRGTASGLSGGEALLFLRLQDRALPAVLGPSGEGRVMLTAETADVRALRLPFPGTPSATHPRVQLLGAVRAGLRCYGFSSKQNNFAAIARCDEIEMRQARAQSALHLALLGQLQATENQPLHCPY